MNSQGQQTRILLVGGGTGGHFYPLIAIAEALNAAPQSPKLYYAGPNAYDPDALSKEGVTFVRVPAGKRRRYASLHNFFDIFKVLFGTIVAVLKLYIIYPDVVVSKGGFTSVPVVLAAAFLRIPIVVHESDVVMGSANKIGVRFARDVVVSYEEVQTSLKHPRVHLLGIPVRKELLTAPTPDAVTALKIDPNRPLILILGGSQGAERINALILDSLDELLTDFSVIHQTGDAHYSLCTLSADRLIPDTERRQHYHPSPFLSGTELNNAYHLAQVVIARAGSNSIYEIAVHGKPAILIPIPETISHDQRSNAYAYARSGGAVVMEEQNMTDSLLRNEIDRIMQDDTVYTAMVQGAQSFAKKDAAAQMSNLLIGIAQEH